MDTLPPDQQSSTSAWGVEQTLLVTDQELRMNAELSAISEDLSVMYRGAKYSLLNENDPDCLRHAAVSMRELFNTLPEKDDRIPARKNVAGQADMIARLKTKWIPISDLHEKELTDLSGQQTIKVRGYITQSKLFFDWHEGHSLSVREQHQILLDTYDPRRSSLPEETREEILENWIDYDTFFNRVTHGAPVIIQEFKDKLSRFEELFLMLVSPQTGSDFTEIDDLIKEVEDG